MTPPDDRKSDPPSPYPPGAANPNAKLESTMKANSARKEAPTHTQPGGSEPVAAPSTARANAEGEAEMKALETHLETAQSYLQTLTANVIEMCGDTLGKTETNAFYALAKITTELLGIECTMYSFDRIVRELRELKSVTAEERRTLVEGFVETKWREMVESGALQRAKPPPRGDKRSSGTYAITTQPKPLRGTSAEPRPRPASDGARRASGKRGTL